MKSLVPEGKDLLAPSTCLEDICGMAWTSTSHFQRPGVVTTFRTMVGLNIATISVPSSKLGEPFFQWRLNPREGGHTCVCVCVCGCWFEACHVSGWFGGKPVTRAPLFCDPAILTKEIWGNTTLP